MKVLDLGCGNDKYKGAIGLDIVKTQATDVVWDIEKTPLPFEDNEFDLVYSMHVMEHIKNLDSLLKEVHRILKPSGVFRIIVPYYSSFQAITNHHVRFFQYHSFDIYEKSNGAHYMSDGIDFKVLKRRLIFGHPPYTSKFNFLFNPLFNSFPDFYQRFLAYIIPCEDVEYELKVIK